MRVIDDLKEKIKKAYPEFSSIDDLVNTKSPYPELVQPLLEALSHYAELDAGKLEFIIRALTVKEAKGKANNPLLDCVFDLAAQDIKKLDRILWAVGNAFTIIVQPDDVAAIGKVLKTKEFERGREMFALALGKIRNPEAEAILIDCLSDEDTAAHAISGLKAMKSKKALPYIQEKVSSSVFLEKREAQKYLKSYEKW